MCISFEVSFVAMLAGYGTALCCALRGEGTDRGHAVYEAIHGTWQAFDLVLWWDIDRNGNDCSAINKLLSDWLLPLLVCFLCLYQMMFAQCMLLLDGRRVELTRWVVFKFDLMVLLCYFVMFGAIRSGRCTTILSMETLVSSRLLEWCDQEFSLPAMAVYVCSAVVGYDDPVEPSKLYALTRSTPLIISICVVLAQVVLFRGLHLSLLCLFCFGMISNREGLLVSERSFLF